MDQQVESVGMVTQQVARDIDAGAAIPPHYYPQTDPFAYDCATGSMVQHVQPVPAGFMRLRNHNVVVPIDQICDF